MCDRKKKTEKLFNAAIFGSLGATKKIALVRPMPYFNFAYTTQKQKPDKQKKKKRGNKKKIGSR